MRRLAASMAIAVLLGACGDEEASRKAAVPGEPGAVKTVASARALRRAYDGAPPVIPHDSFAADCMTCHGGDGVSLPDIGYSPPAPHGETSGLSDGARCTQCHLWKKTDDLLVANDFVGLAQDLRHGARLHPLAPPVIPHRVFMRENCRACHTGPAAREEIRCPHPERVRCTQCHLERKTNTKFP